MLEYPGRGKDRGPMPKRKIAIVIGILAIIAISVRVAITSGAIDGIAFFFILTCLLWVIAKARHWI